MVSGGPTSVSIPTDVSDSKPTLAASPTTSAAIAGFGDIKNGPLAKAGQDLVTLYQEFQEQGGKAPFTSSESGLVEIQGTNVEVDIHSNGGDFNGFISALTSMGMQVRTTDAADGTVEGFLPISQLPSAAQNSQTLSVSPVYVPHQAANGL
jgi:hypothetical protein